MFCLNCLPIIHILERKYVGIHLWEKKQTNNNEGGGLILENGTTFGDYKNT